MVSIPSKPEHVTPSWLSTILGRQISSQNFSVSPNIQNGSGYLSQMFRVSCISDEDNEQLNLIIKLLPAKTDADTTARDVVISEGFDVTEINFYTQTRPDLLAQVGDLQRNLCEFYYATVNKNPRNSMLILEDLKPKGYITKTFAEKITMGQIDQVVRFIAKFHCAASVVQHKRKKSLKEIYPFIQVYGDDIEECSIFKWNMEGLGSLDKFLEDQNVEEEMRDYYKKLEPFHKEFSKQIFLKMNNDFSTLVHDDLWSNNFLVCDTNEENPVIVIDFQILTYGDAAYDLAVLILACLPMAELTRPNVDRILKLYYESYCHCFEENCIGIEGERMKRRDFNEFSEFFNTYGMSYAFLWFTSHNVHPFEADLGKLLNIYRFLWKEADFVNFLLKNL